MIWIANLVVAAILYGVAHFFHMVGWEIALAYLCGYMACYLFYGCWRVDDRNEGYSRFPHEEREARFERDRIIDPRLR
jgi:hypothetical protein